MCCRGVTKTLGVLLSTKLRRSSKNSQNILEDLETRGQTQVPPIAKLKTKDNSHDWAHLVRQSRLKTKVRLMERVASAMVLSSASHTLALTTPLPPNAVLSSGLLSLIS
ncbi:hypothetical protein E2C01_037605 [Portunus trituberculatus]|uniref:Uncharacterized protein n=1 Tax=Portunus trituberculatus TaxID=210409 RepID=A0A5B7FEJ7_PORTR|nr:hypothetical protein [Portunus trituberculatus]